MLSCLSILSILSILSLDIIDEPNFIFHVHSLSIWIHLVYRVHLICCDAVIYFLYFLILSTVQRGDCTGLTEKPQCPWKSVPAQMLAQPWIWVGRASNPKPAGDDTDVSSKLATMAMQCHAFCRHEAGIYFSLC